MTQQVEQERQDLSAGFRKQQLRARNTIREWPEYKRSSLIVTIDGESHLLIDVRDAIDEGRMSPQPNFESLMSCLPGRNFDLMPNPKLRRIKNRMMTGLTSEQTRWEKPEDLDTGLVSFYEREIERIDQALIKRIQR